MLSWFPYFYKYQDEDYNLKIKNLYPKTSPKNKNVWPVRRKIAYDYEKNEKDVPDTFVNTTINKFSKGYQPGNTKKDRGDKESRVRQVVSTSAQLGLMYSHSAKLTDMGEKIVRNTFDSDDLIRQLLKMYIVSNDNQSGVFPFKTFLKLIKIYDFLSRNEMSFIFGVLNDKDVDKAINAVGDFRKEYNQLSNKNIDKKVKIILKKTWNKYFPLIKDTTLFKTVREDYTDAFTRYLVFTNLFISEGRGTSTKIKIKEINSEKVNLLISQNPFLYPPKDKNGKFVSSEYQSNWFGKIDDLKLPWENKTELADIVKYKIKLATTKFSGFSNPEISWEKLRDWCIKLSSFTIDDLKDIEKKLDDAIKNANIKKYIQKTSQTCENRKEVLNRYQLIQNDDDESALWLEVNTWRAFVSINGLNKEVVPNFKMNPDLTPKSFAPGIGNTPDMEIYFGSYVIIPEVSLMTGVQQWEHEGSSVIDHVIKKMKDNKNKEVLGLFISSSINIRTNWQFFILNRESWLGEPVPVVPMKLETFIKILTFIYKRNLKIDDFNALIWKISRSTSQLKNYKEWDICSNQIIENWEKKAGKLV